MYFFAERSEYDSLLLADSYSFELVTDKPRIKDILWKHYDRIEKTFEEGRLRDAILDNVQRTLLCKTLYLGYDTYDCTSCDNRICLYRHCHSRFCLSCDIKYQKQLSLKAEVMCIDVKHRHVVFTIPESYREIFRKDRELKFHSRKI